MRRSLTTATFVVGLALVATGLALPASATEGLDRATTVTPSLPGEITLPPLYGTELPRLSALQVGGTGVLWKKNGTDGWSDPVYYAPAEGRPNTPAPDVRGEDWNAAGDYVFWGPRNNGIDFASQAYNLLTGETTQLRSEYASTYGRFIGGTGAGWLDELQVPMRITYTDMATRTEMNLGLPPLPPGETEWYFGVRLAAVDANGAVFDLSASGSPYDYNTYLYYVDFATGSWTLLDSQVAGPGATLSGNWIAWKSWGNVKSVARNTPSAQPKVRAYGEEWPVGLALSGDTLALVRETAYGSGEFLFATGPADDNLVDAPIDSRLKLPLFQGPDGAFAMVGGTTVESYGVYAFGSDRATLSRPIALFGSAAPLGIDASAGRLLAVRSGQRSVVERLVTEPNSSTVKVHGATTLVPKYTSNQAPDPSGGHSVYLKQIDGHPHVIVQDGTTVTQAIRVPDGTYEVTESGRRVLIAWSNPNGSRGGYWVIDLVTGERTEIDVRIGAALWGQYFAYMLEDGSIRLRDTATGTARTIKGPGFPAYVDPDDLWYLLPMRAFGDWIVCVADGGSQAINVVTGEVVPIPSGAFSSFPTLSSDTVAWQSEDDRLVHVMSLRTKEIVVVGQARKYEPNREYLALTDEFVAWVAPDDTTRVLPLAGIPAPTAPVSTSVRTAAATPSPFAATTSPRYLGASGSSAFTPNGDGKGDRFRPRIDTSRPLTAWRLDIRDGKGKVIRTLTGSAPKGNVRPDWNGLTTSGYRAKSGTYTWRLTGVGADGPLRRSNGSSTPILGTVKLSR